MSTPTLSVITGHWERHNEIARLTRWVAERTPPVDYEFLIADCSEVPFDPASVGEAGTHARIVRDWPKSTCSLAYERMVREARGEFVLWLNDDAEPFPNYAENALKFMRANPTVGLGALYWCHSTPPFFVDQWPAGVPYANFGIFRKELAVRWEHPFDADLVPMYGLDNAPSLKVWLAGLGVVGIPDARVINHRIHDAQRQHNETNYVGAGGNAATHKLMMRYGERMDEVRANVAKFAHMQGPKEIRA